MGNNTKNGNPASLDLPRSSNASLDDGGKTIIDVLIAEYQNLHARVFRQISRYEDANVKMLMLLGILVAYGFLEYDKPSIGIAENITNSIFIIALPLLSLCNFALGISELINVMILGDYLSDIEKKINSVLEPTINRHKEYHLPRNKVLDFEYWRVFEGTAKKGNFLSEISFSLIIVLLIFTISFVFSFVRLNTVIQRNSSSSVTIRWKIILAIVWGVYLICAAVLLRFLAKHRKKSIDNVRSDSHTYGITKK